MFLAIEFIDELVFGVREAAWPAIRSDLHLSYAQIGLLLAVPDLVGTVVEPLLGLLGDSGRRRHIVFIGGVVFTLALALVAGAGSFAILLIAFAAFSPSSGAFVSLSQATLMDIAPDERERNMARWVLSGSVANVAGPLVATAAIAIGLGWRPVFGVMALVALPVVTWSLRIPHPAPEARPLRELARGAVAALRRPDVLRWLAILDLQDLLGDVFLGFLALYLYDVAGASKATAGIAVAVWTASFLLGSAVLVRALRWLDGLRYLRVSSLATLAIYPAFLLVPFLWMKFALVAVLGLTTSGWYSVSKARFYASMHGASGTAMALSSVVGVGGLEPLAVAFVAGAFGLNRAMWVLLVAPLSMLALVPRAQPNERA